MVTAQRPGAAQGSPPLTYAYVAHASAAAMQLLRLLRGQVLLPPCSCTSAAKELVAGFRKDRLMGGCPLATLRLQANAGGRAARWAAEAHVY